jgi:hypothetical protein
MKYNYDKLVIDRHLLEFIFVNIVIQVGLVESLLHYKVNKKSKGIKEIVYTCIGNEVLLTLIKSSADAINKIGYG